MALRISPDNESRLMALMESGPFTSVDDVLSSALDLLSERQERDALREAIAIGIADIHAGAIMVADDAFWERIDHDVDQDADPSSDKA